MERTSLYLFIFFHSTPVAISPWFSKENVLTQVLHEVRVVETIVVVVASKTHGYVARDLRSRTRLQRRRHRISDNFAKQQSTG